MLVHLHSTAPLEFLPVLPYCSTVVVKKYPRAGGVNLWALGCLPNGSLHFHPKPHQLLWQQPPATVSPWVYKLGLYRIIHIYCLLNLLCRRFFDCVWPYYDGFSCIEVLWGLRWGSFCDSRSAQRFFAIYVVSPCFGMLLASHKYEYGVSLPYHDDLRRSVNWLLCNT